MKRKLSIFIALVISIQIVVSGCAVDGEMANMQEKIKKPVKVFEANKNKYSDEISISGNIKPSKTVKVAFKVPGVIDKIDFEEGSSIKEGSLLASLDSYQYRLNMIAAQSNYESLQLKVKSEIPSAINQAKSQLDLMQKRHDSISKLYEKGSVSEDKLDEIKRALITIENKYNEAINAQQIYAKKLEQARAMSELADSNLADASLYSPIDGIVVKKLFEAGETVAAGYPVVVLGKLDNVEAEIGVPDEHINKMKKGQKTKVYVYGVEKEYDGVITEIGAMADTKTRTFPVKITIENMDLALKPGMVAKATIPFENMESILVPIDSVINMPEGPTVFVYSQKENIVNKRLVTTGSIVKDKVEIIEGLSDGEKIIVKGQFKLKNNDIVKVEGDK
jgi:RND family efflux transporter MFP subunit